MGTSAETGGWQSLALGSGFLSMVPWTLDMWGLPGFPQCINPTPSNGLAAGWTAMVPWGIPRMASASRKHRTNSSQETPNNTTKGTLTSTQRHRVCWSGSGHLGVAARDSENGLAP